MSGKEARFALPETQNIMTNENPHSLAATPRNLTQQHAWDQPVVLARTGFSSPYLSAWSLNCAIGCGHGCKFCYVPGISTARLQPKLEQRGVTDPDAEWGRYVFLRRWDETEFERSLQRASRLSERECPPGTVHGVMVSSATDPFQVVPHPDPTLSEQLTRANEDTVCRALERIRDGSNLNVRILTRSPRALNHLALFKSFGRRLIFGMSLPTLREDLARVYEPFAPPPAARLAALHTARDFGLHIYVSVAPTYPECDFADILATITKVADLQPVIVLHEPINLRGQNSSRILSAGVSHDLKLDRATWASHATWAEYAIDSYRNVLVAAKKAELASCIYFTPDSSLAWPSVVAAQRKPAAFVKWLESCRQRERPWPV